MRSGAIALKNIQSDDFAYVCFAEEKNIEIKKNKMAAFS